MNSDLRQKGGLKLSSQNLQVGLDTYKFLIIEKEKKKRKKMEVV